MKKFFQTTKFKVLAVILVAFAGVMTYLGVSGKLSTVFQEIVMAVTVPVRKVTSLFTGGLEEFVDKYVFIDDIIAENEALQAENEELRAQLLELDEYRAKIEMYEIELQIREENPTFETVSASVIDRDPAAKYYAFTIDKGTRDGIQVADVVITQSGVVGRVVEVGPNYAKVVTILDPSVNISCIVSRTRDNGMLTGNAEYSLDGFCTLTLLPRETAATQGDDVITTGNGGLFPKGLSVGVVQEIIPDSSGKSMYAVIEPSVDIQSVRTVVVITNYSAYEEPDPTETD